MVGYISEAVAKAIRDWPALKKYNVIPIRATEGDSVTVNTPLPAIAIHVMGDEGEGNTFFGGGIRQYFELQLYCLLPAPNYTFTFDKGAQANMLDLSDEALRCMERTTKLDELKLEHDLNLQFDRVETDQTYATTGANTVTVDVHKIIYKGSVDFDLYSDKEKHPTTEVELKQVDIIEKDYENNRE